MGKKLIITEKPSVARAFAAALGGDMRNAKGYMESDEYIITWCVGHLVTMCYPEEYDPALKRWNLNTIPFIPNEYKYQVIENVKDQFAVIKSLFNRKDVDVIYNAGDSGREGEYIQRLVKQEAGCNENAVWKRVWIDSQTEDEIRRGIAEAKDMSEYDNLSDAAYLRAKEDYLMGINFSRVLTLKYGDTVKGFLNTDKCVISVGRVMTCVQGMVVNREREIRQFTEMPFYKIQTTFSADGTEYIGEWKVTDDSEYKGALNLYKENGFKTLEDANAFIDSFKDTDLAEVVKVEKKKSNKNAPLLYNLAELQNECSKLFKISPDVTLQIAQELYEKKMTTYPRTDARVLSTAVAKEITKNLSGLSKAGYLKGPVDHILENKMFAGLGKSRYVNDSQITDHYAIIPTGEGFSAFSSLSPVAKNVYEVIVRRFVSIFYPPAVSQKITIETKMGRESFFSNYTTLLEEGYMQIMKYSFAKKKEDDASKTGEQKNDKVSEDELEQSVDDALEAFLNTLKKGKSVKKEHMDIKEGKTSPPKRYTGGSLILAMENAGNLIEDEELRAQIKGSGIGTSATRGEILKKLNNNKYLKTNSKTQVITPTLLGEIIYEVVSRSIKPLLNPELTASWEKGLTGVAGGDISSDEYLVKLNDFVSRRTNYVKAQNTYELQLPRAFSEIQKYY
ncbi:MAG: type IA DNA topoisomerase [Lachnospiraceae bacterium]|nr:type IA DNA topoisomerase [Candidatus Colinaster scatohippi]